MIFTEIMIMGVQFVVPTAIIVGTSGLRAAKAYGLHAGGAVLLTSAFGGSALGQLFTLPLLKLI